MDKDLQKQNFKGKKKKQSINQFVGRVEQQFKRLRALYPGRYDRSQLKERIFQGTHPNLRDSMQFLYMQDNVGYEEFLAAVYEAENEGTEGKIVNTKAKAMTVEKVIEEREKDELKDLKQQIQSLTIIMKSATMGTGKTKGREGTFSLRKKELLGNSPEKGVQWSPKKGKIPLRPGQKPLQCFRCEGWGHGWCECPTLENFNWRELMGAGVLLTPGSPGSAPTQIQNQNQ